MVGYTVQTGDSGEEGMAKGAIVTKRNRTAQAADVAADDIDDDGAVNTNLLGYVFVIACVIKSIQFM
jgi:hypothetical protein